MARPRRFPTKGTKKIQAKIWELSTGQAAGISAGTTALNFASVGTNPSTLLRIRGEVAGYLLGASAPAVGVRLTYGIILVPEGTGTTVLWDPVTDANAPWLLYGQAHLAYDEKVTDVVDVPGMSSFRHVIDNKAMRIIRPDVEMQFVVTNTTTISADSATLLYGLRWLQGF